MDIAIIEHLPEHVHASVRRAINDAWNSRDPVLALKQLERLARSLEREHPGAAGSLREGLEETLTVQRLGIDGALYDHRAIRARAGPTLGFKTSINAARAIAGIDLVHRICRGKFMLIRKWGPKLPLSMRVAWNLALA